MLAGIVLDGRKAITPEQGRKFVRNRLAQARYVVETETSVLSSAADAIAAAKLRHMRVARRHPGQEPDTFRLMDATGKILGVFPKTPASKSA
jgi:hypothetical protein